jgi:hypothetical protein
LVSLFFLYHASQIGKSVNIFVSFLSFLYSLNITVLSKFICKP